MKEFLANNLLTVAILIVFTAYVLYLAANKKWEQLRAAAYRLMLQAEKTFTGSKRGQEKFEYVFQKVYSLIPFWLQFFFPPGELKELLQEWFNDIKDYLNDSKINGSIYK